MAFGKDTAKIAIDGEEREFLKNINLEGEISYDLTDEAGADVLTVEEIAAAAPRLRANEPDKTFIVVA